MSVISTNPLSLLRPFSGNPETRRRQLDDRITGMPTPRTEREQKKSASVPTTRPSTSGSGSREQPAAAPAQAAVAPAPSQPSPAPKHDSTASSSLQIDPNLPETFLPASGRVSKRSEHGTARSALTLPEPASTMSSAREPQSATAQPRKKRNPYWSPGNVHIPAHAKLHALNQRRGPAVVHQDAGFHPRYNHYLPKLSTTVPLDFHAEFEQKFFSDPDFAWDSDKFLASLDPDARPASPGPLMKLVIAANNRPKPPEYERWEPQYNEPMWKGALPWEEKEAKQQAAAATVAATAANSASASAQTDSSAQASSTVPAASAAGEAKAESKVDGVGRIVSEAEFSVAGDRASRVAIQFKPGVLPNDKVPPSAADSANDAVAAEWKAVAKLAADTAAKEAKQQQKQQQQRKPRERKRKHESELHTASADILEIDQASDNDEGDDENGADSVDQKRKGKDSAAAAGGGADGSAANATFLTGVDAGGMDAPGDDELRPEHIVSVEDAVKFLPPMISFETPPLPDKVAIDEVMEVATTSLEFDPDRPNLEKIYRHYFNKPVTKAVVQDGFWWALCHFFYEIPKEEAKKKQVLEQRKLMTGLMGRMTAHLQSLAERDAARDEAAGKPSTAPAALPSLMPPEPAAAEQQDYTTSVMAAVKNRLAESFVKLFLTVKSGHKDAFFEYFFDGFAQSIYYSMQVAYPESRVQLDRPDLKLKLMQLTARWTMGLVPTKLSAGHWRILLRVPKKNTLIEQALNQSTVTQPYSQNLDFKLKDLRAEIDRNERQREKHRANSLAAARQGQRPYLTMPRNRADPGSPLGVSTSNLPLPKSFMKGMKTFFPAGYRHKEKMRARERERERERLAEEAEEEKRREQIRAQDELEARGGLAGLALEEEAAHRRSVAGQAHDSALALSLHLGTVVPGSPGLTSASGGAGGGGANSANSNSASYQYGEKVLNDRSRLGTGPHSGADPSGSGAGSGAQYGSLLALAGVASAGAIGDTSERSGADAAAVAQAALAEAEKRRRRKERDPDRIPMKVSRTPQLLHHSELVQHFFQTHAYPAHSRQHELTLPITHSDGTKGSQEMFLNAVMRLNQETHQTNKKVHETFEQSHAQLNKMTQKQARYLQELKRKLEQDQEIARREAATYTKTLVAEYQSKKYQELKEPNKAGAASHARRMQRAARLTSFGAPSTASGWGALDKDKEEAVTQLVHSITRLKRLL